jgi:aminopeptidase-like protein
VTASARDLADTPIPADAGARMHAFVSELYPLCRSITGDGLRRTLELIGSRIPLEIREVPTGTPVFDWSIPREWNIRDAYVKNAKGERVIDFRSSNLSVVNYSVPVSAQMTLAELRPRLHSLPDRPRWIPYRTSYYKEDWGFCLSHERLLALEEGTYEVVIDATLAPGSLSYGELLLRGATDDEVLISAHACHPSLANDNLAGIAVATFLAALLQDIPCRYSYRFVFAPGTIGAIAWLAAHRDEALRIRHGLVLACLGDAGRPNYKKSRRGDAAIDRAAMHVLAHRGEHGVRDFSPLGYDERQYGSPGFDLPVGSLTRTPNGAYPEYHTSADDPAFVRPEALADSLAILRDIVSVLENDAVYTSTNPFCEPQLGKRGLYSALGGRTFQDDLEVALLWTLNLADGKHGLLDIAERSGLPFDRIRRAAAVLREHGLLVPEGGAK